MEIIFDFDDITLKCEGECCTTYDFKFLSPSEVAEKLASSNLNCLKITQLCYDGTLIELRETDRILVDQNLAHLISLMNECGVGKTFVATIHYVYNYNPDVLYEELTKKEVDTCNSNFIGEFSFGYDAAREYLDYYGSEIDLTDYIDYHAVAEDFLQKCYGSFYFRDDD